MWTNDPVADFGRYDAKRARIEKDLPHCDYCGNAIYENYYYISDETICPKCLDEHFLHTAEI